MIFRRVRLLLPQRWHVKCLRKRTAQKRAFRSRPGPISRSGRVMLYAALALSAVWVIVALVSAHMRPLIEKAATARVNYLASAAIHDAIAKRLDDGTYTYDSIINFEKDADGRITALKTDMLVVNRMKADITRDVIVAIKDIGTSELGIPVGNLLSSELLSGRGPLIPVRIVPIGTAGADFSNVFTAAGINQTRHQIMMTIQAELSVLLPGDTAITSVSVQVNVAETVIVGAVPGTYANFDAPLPSDGG